MRELHFKDVLLLPKYSEVGSRSEVSTSQSLGQMAFQMPIVPANMKTIIDFKLAKYLAENGYFYIMHRFGVDFCFGVDIVDFCFKMHEAQIFRSISVGVNDDSMELVERLGRFPETKTIEFITIDIAHGHCLKMQKMIEFIKRNLPSSFVIAGNVCTKDGAKALASWGADCIKVGIGSGSVCTTKLQTGFSRPQFTAVHECSRAVNIAVISDGGIEHNGDIAKALVAGARFVMLGRSLAGFEESPGRKIIHDDGRITKEYYGSASEHNKGAKEYVEGCRVEIPYRGSIADKLKEVRQSLASSISYAGGSDIHSLRNVSWIENISL